MSSEILKSAKKFIEKKQIAFSDQAFSIQYFLYVFYVQLRTEFSISGICLM